jgi:zinc/manganese transport system permease protein
VVTVILGVLLMIGMAHVGLGFYLLFACAVTLSVQLAGIYLVFASLIIPALTVRRVRGRHGLSVAWGIGAAGYGLGLVLSAQFDVPSGAMIVCALAAVALLFALIAGKRLSG